MKKEKEWFMGEIDKNLISETFNRLELRMDLYELECLIDQLDEPELTQEQVDKYLYERNFVAVDAMMVHQTGMQNKVVVEKPVIPKFASDWIDAHNLYGNNPLREYRDLEIDFNEGWTDEKDADVYHWVNKNPYAFIDALRYGYDAEKEKLYTVDLPHSYELIKLLHTQTYHIKKYNESGFGDYTNTFTEAEIKKIDERLMVFAEEVKPCN